MQDTADVSGSAADADGATATKAPFQVPADFGAAQLGEPDFSSKQMAERSLPALFLRRWLHLREQVPTRSCYVLYPSYKSVRSV